MGAELELPGVNTKKSRHYYVCTQVSSGDQVTYHLHMLMASASTSVQDSCFTTWQTIVGTLIPSPYLFSTL